MARPKSKEGRKSRRGIYLSDAQLTDLYYSESLDSYELEEGDSKEYKESKFILYKELVHRGLVNGRRRNLIEQIYLG